MAPVIRASNLGRVPTITARILRRLYKEGTLGRDLIVVGTNALYAYEARAGVRIGEEFIATGDVDLLLDARRRLKFASVELRQEGLLRLLRRIDRSFALVADYRAINNNGFFVDLIRPRAQDELRTQPIDQIGEERENLRASPIEGLSWLINVPKFEQTAVGEDGLPVPIVAIDPRAFAMHKLWLAGRPEREQIKKARDRGQAAIAATLAIRYLSMIFDDPSLKALPTELRAMSAQLQVNKVPEAIRSEL